MQLWRQARYEVSLPEGFEGACNVGLEFDLWRSVGQRFLDHLRRHRPKVALALWPGERRQVERWLRTGLIDLAFCYLPPSAESFASRVLFDDELILVSTRDEPRPYSARAMSTSITVTNSAANTRPHSRASRLPHSPSPPPTGPWIIW